jgi:hypothetical protein
MWRKEAGQRAYTGAPAYHHGGPTVVERKAAFGDDSDPRRASSPPHRDWDSKLVWAAVSQSAIIQRRDL